MAVVKCPTCGDAVVWSAASPYRPFCSDRCKNVDLGAWASERYTIAGDADDRHDGVDPDNGPDR
jgi:endogenous inhibitor of DNA gyrase (YacG/DUF329 family)